MSVIICGGKLCKDCIEFLQKADEANLQLDFRDITTELKYLKAFLSLREGNPLFNEARVNNQIGIPFFIFPDGTQTLDCELAIRRLTVPESISPQ